MNAIELFKIVDNYPWHSIKAQMGYCKNVPQSLKKLIDENEEIRKSGYWQLDNHIVVQGELYDGSFYIIPFLFELLKINNEFNAEQIYDLISQIYSGYGGENIITFDELNDGFTYFIPSTKSSISLSLSEQCKKAIFTGFELFLNEVETNRLQCRYDAISLLMSFTDQQKLVISSLRELSKRLNNPQLSILIEKNISENFTA